MTYGYELVKNISVCQDDHESALNDCGKLDESEVLWILNARQRVV
jgi:hypothetical protein